MRQRVRILPVLLLLALAFASAVPARAEQSLLLGFVAGPSGLVRDEAQAQTLVAHLAERLSFPLQLRLFADEDQLHQWLHRYRAIDCAWLGEAFFRRLPAGEALPLAVAQNLEGTSRAGFFVVRQGLDVGRVKQLLTALQSLDEIVGAELGVVRFVPPPLAPPVPAGWLPMPPAQAAVVPASAPAHPAVEPVPSEFSATPDVSDIPAASAVSPPPLPEAQSEAVVAPPAPPAAQLPDERGAPAVLSADQLDYAWGAEVLEATGSVSLRQGDVTLTTDALLLQQLTRDVIASGNVRLSDPDSELWGSSAHTNLGSGRGLVRDGRAFVRERNFHLTGAEVERLGEATYRVDAGSFTTCDGEIPDWRFTASQVDVDLGGYATARDVWFEIRNQPLLYLPYLVFPVKSERESGFLLPRAGYSSRKGALLSLAWYEVIDRHLDATVYVDYLSRLGLGKGLEYRYNLGAAGQGQVYAYHVSGIDTTPDSYALDWQHDGLLPGGVRLAADVEYVSKREYFEDFGEDAEEYNRDQTVATILAQRNWQKLNLTGYARYIKDLENDNDATLQRLPEAGMDVPFYRLGAHPLYTRTELRATSFWREDESAGEDGQRLYLRQGLGLVLKPGSWLEFSPEVAVYGRNYHADSGSEADLIPEYSATLSTRLARVYPFARWGIDALQHSIEPQVSYTYVPNENQDDLPFFDLKDRIGPLNLVSYALVNRLTARFADANGRRFYRELLNLRLSQAYDVREERADSLDDPEPFSDLRAELMLRPTPATALDVDALVRVHDEAAFTRLNVGAGYDDGAGNSARLAYLYRSEESGFDPTDYLSLEIGTALLAPVHVSVKERYDFRDDGALETVLGLEYRAKCWSLFLTYRDRPDEEEILVGFALSGLGRVGGFGSSLRSER